MTKCIYSKYAKLAQHLKTNQYNLPHQQPKKKNILTIDLEKSSLTHKFFKDILFNFQWFQDFLVISLLLISRFIASCLENTVILFF